MLVKFFDYDFCYLPFLSVSAFCFKGFRGSKGYDFNFTYGSMLVSDAAEQKNK